MATNAQEQPKWYKTGAGIVFLGVLSMIAVGGLLFLGFVGYYTLQIHRGNGDDIAAELREAKQKFSSDPSLASAASSSQVESIAPYIRPFDPKFGNTDSPVTILAFIDFECPYCQASYSTFEQLRDRYEAGVHIIIKQFPLDSIHPYARQAALAAACANEQDAFWDYYSLLFTKKDLSKEALLNYSTTLGLKDDVFADCLNSRRYDSSINQDIQDGLALGVRGTPTYYVNTTKLEGVIPLTTWDETILAAIKQSNSSL